MSKDSRADTERERGKLRKVQTVWKYKLNKKKGGASQLKAPDAYGCPRVPMPPRTPYARGFRPLIQSGSSKLPELKVALASHTRSGLTALLSLPLEK